MPPLQEKTILIWRYLIPEYPFSFWKLLSPEEKQKASTFVFEKDRLGYLFCRGMLRWLLSKYTGIEPQLIPLKYTISGKPYLCQDTGLPPITFNLSHTTNAVLIALSLKTELGIDLETLYPFAEMLYISQNYFTHSEQRYIQQFSGRNQTKAFFYCWTRKEALFKGLKIGLATEKFKSISCLENHPDLSCFGITHKQWTIETLAISSKYVAAIAHLGKGYALLQLEQPWQYYTTC